MLCFNYNDRLPKKKKKVIEEQEEGGKGRMIALRKNHNHNDCVSEELKREY